MLLVDRPETAYDEQFLVSSETGVVGRKLAKHNAMADEQQYLWSTKLN